MTALKNEVKIDWLKYENEAKADGFNVVCGIDEAGRGPLAGPVCAAAVILPDGCIIDGVNDSKKLTEKKREQLFEVIKETAVAYSIATADEKEIDEINILQATYLAMNRAFNGLKIKPDMALVDGNRDPNLGIPTRTIVKGDAASMSIAAASILAKVTRDRFMLEMDKKYPEYQFAKHKGYGTNLHYEMLDKYGASEIHRMSFLRKYYENK